MTDVPEIQLSHSDSIAKFMPAFIKARDSMGAVIKDARNPHLKSTYATLEAVLDVAEPALQSQGIALIQIPFSAADRVGVTTWLWHESGEYLRGVLGLKPAKADPQAEGSAITYARRYSAMTMCGIVPEDDDGNAASGRDGRRDDRRDDPPTYHPPERQQSQRGGQRMNSSQAKKEGAWEQLTGALALCRTEDDVDAWGRKYATEIKALPRKWYEQLREEREKHLDSLQDRRSSRGGPEPLDTPDSDFPPDWEKWQNDLASQITQARTPDDIDAIMDANVDGLIGCEDVFKGSKANLEEHAAAVKQRLSDQAKRGR